MFKEPNKILKIASIVLVAIIVIACSIWLIIDVSNNYSIYADLFYIYKIDNPEWYVQNPSIIVITCMIGLSIITLLICWMKKLLHNSGSVLRVVIILASVLSLCALLVWLFSGISDIIEECNALRENYLDTFDDFKAHSSLWYGQSEVSAGTVLECNNALIRISNYEVEQIITHVLTVLLCAFGVFVSAVVIYYLADGFGRIVRSLETLAYKVESELARENCCMPKERNLKTELNESNYLEE